LCVHGMTEAVAQPTASPPRPRLLFSSIFVWISITGGRFLSTLLQDAGLTDSEIGVCFALQTVTQSLLSSFAGSYADAYERRYPGQGRTRILMAGILCGSFFFLLQGLHHIWPAGNHHFVVNSVAWHVSLRVLYAGSTSLVFPVLDGLTLDFLSHQSDGHGKADFGKERLHGAIWWAITNLVMGPSLDWLGFSILYVYSIFSALAVIVTIHIYTQARSVPDQNEEEAKSQTVEMESLTAANTPGASSGHGNQGHEDVLPPLGFVRRKSHLVEEKDDLALKRLSLYSIARCVLGTKIGGAFMLAVFSLSIGTAVVESLIFLYFEVLGSSYSLCALTVLLTVLCEIGLFAYGPQLLKKYGTVKLFLTAGVCYITRVIGYSVVPDGHPWFVLFFEPLHGITYACASISSVDFVAQLMPVGYESSGQGLLYALRGCGSVLGLLFGGIGDDLLGPRTVYRCLAGVVAVGFTVLALASLKDSTATHHECETSEDTDSEGQSQVAFAEKGLSSVELVCS
jgi:MFS_1 like family